MNRVESLRREKETDLRVSYKNASVALADTALGLQASKEALLVLGNSRAASLLESHLTFVTELRFSLREKFAETFSENEAAFVFEMPSENRGAPRHLTSFKK